MWREGSGMEQSLEKNDFGMENDWYEYQIKQYVPLTQYEDVLQSKMSFVFCVMECVCFDYNWNEIFKTVKLSRTQH